MLKAEADPIIVHFVELGFVAVGTRECGEQLYYDLIDAKSDEEQCITL